MLLKTILNHCHKFKCFVYTDVKITTFKNRECIEVFIEHRKNSQAICSSCHTKAPGYDRSSEFRRFEFIPVWGIPVFFLYSMRRVNCKPCGIRTEEVSWKKGHKYLTLVYQINVGSVRLLWIGKNRTAESFQVFFDSLGQSKCKLIQYVCSDMWKAYLKVIQERVPQAIHVSDRYHIVANLNKALDKVRSEEHKSLKSNGYEAVLTKARWVLLKKPQNLTSYQSIKLKELLKYNLKRMRAYLLKEEFQNLWDYCSVAWAGKFIDAWTKKVMLSKIDPLKKEALTIRKHKDLILNYFRAKKQLSSGIVEGLNTKVKLTMKKSYGFKHYKTAETALYHSLGRLPEPPLTHRFY